MIPAWLSTAQSLIGTCEAPGAANNPTIMGWAKALGAKVLGIAYLADSLPWCSLFQSYCMMRAGIRPPLIAIRAKSWATWGDAVHPCLGAVVVLTRDGGGHVGMATGITADGTAIRLVSGNVSDRVCEAWFDADRIVAVRWPTGVVNPTIKLPVAVRGTLSTNEA